MKYLITSAQEETRGFMPFIKNINTYATVLGAEVLVLPYARGKYFSQKDMDPTITDSGFTILDEDLKIGAHLEAKIMCIGGQQIDPLTGIERFVTANKSAIVASPKQALRCIATINELNLPKVLMSTGTITIPNYKNTAQGVKSIEDHVYGFIFVEILDNGMFNYRPVRADSLGNFMDLTYSSSKTKAHVDTVVLGDLHAQQISHEILEKTLAMLKDLNPKQVVLHDIFDGASVNHHEQFNFIKQIGVPTINDEVKTTANVIKQIMDNCSSKILIVKSNHDEWLDSYLDTGRFAKDPINLKYAANLLLQKVNGKDPLQYAIEHELPRTRRLVWLNRLSTVKSHGIEVGQHGDKGANGSKGNHKSAPKVFGKAILGHEHTPAILNDCYVVGTSTHLRLPYSSSGPSSWMNTHAIVHNNGKVQLINIL